MSKGDATRQAVIDQAVEIAGRLGVAGLTIGTLASATGFCGGYTTFSTAMVETVRLIQAGELRRATANALGSLLLCLGAAALGVGIMAI